MYSQEGLRDFHNQKRLLAIESKLSDEERVAIESFAKTTVLMPNEVAFLVAQLVDRGIK
jgi:hypothetical protein